MAGPHLHGLFGRRMGSLPGYAYSPRLARGDITWTPETVADLFTRGPDVVTPGTKMPVQTLGNPEEMAALLRFLAEATRWSAPRIDTPGGPALGIVEARGIPAGLAAAGAAALGIVGPAWFDRVYRPPGAAPLRVIVPPRLAAAGVAPRGVVVAGGIAALLLARPALRPCAS